jgi:hypothetical protein
MAILENISDIQEQIKALVIGCDRNQEQCGIVVDGQAILLPNDHPESESNFYISSRTLTEYEDIDCVWHTHCADTQPGLLTYPDIESSKRSRIPFLLYHTIFDVWDYYDYRLPNPFPLQNPDFDPKAVESYVGVRSHWGRSDCFSLVRCFYLGMFGIDMGDFTRPPLDTFPPPEYDCPWDGNIFTSVSLHELQVYDAVGIALKGGMSANHAGILLPENRLLHSLTVGKRSQIDIYGKFWQHRTIYGKRICLPLSN